MSLLMDALRKAEQAKRGGRLDASAELGDLPALPTSAPAPPDEMAAAAPPPPADAGGMPAAAAPTVLPDLPAKLEVLDSQFTADAPADPARDANAPTRRRTDSIRPEFLKPGPAPAADAAERKAAQNTFAAKQPARRDDHATVIGGALVLLAVGAIGIYFWLQLKPAPSATTPTMTAMPPRPAAEPSAAMADAAQASPGPALAVPETPRPAPAQRPAAIRPQSAPAADLESPIRITRSHPTVNPALADAYAAFQAGRLAQARTAYEDLLRTDANNADALRGAAAVALREGREADARNYYQHLIEADPKDAIAQAGLAGLDAHGDPIAGESRLKTALAGQPDSPALHFALGNLYARQGRWGDAQQAYFDAVTGEGDNPDYLFNLAVSLDQLHQAKPAAQYYRQALTAAAARPAAFDTTRAAARLRALQP